MKPSKSQKLLTRICLYLLFLSSFCIFYKSAAAQESQMKQEYPQIKIVINIPSLKLALYEDEKLVKEYSISVGQPKYPTPLGTFEIIRVEWNPWWYPPPSDWAKDAEVTPPGPTNPLGPVKMVLNTDLRIHGTNQDRSVGRPASHGCFRMHNAEARELAWYLQTRLSQKTDPALLEKYKRARNSTFVVTLEKTVPVELIYQPIKISDDIVEIYPDFYGKIKKLKDDLLEVLVQKGIDPAKVNQEKLSTLKKPKKSESYSLQEFLL